MIPRPLTSTMAVSLLMTSLLLAVTPMAGGQDTTPPEVLSFYPQNRAYNVPLDAPIFVNFSEPMNPITVTVTMVPSVAFDPPIWGAGMNLVLSHSNPFIASTMYTATVTGMDLAGNPLDGDGDGTGGDALAWTFSTQCPGICIVDTVPADGQVNIPVNNPIVVTFSDRINPATVTITMVPTLTLTETWMNGDTVLTLQHATSFSDCAQYSMTISSPALVPGPVPNPWHFTAAGCSPMIMHIDPPQTDALITASIVVDFSEEMDADSVTWSLNRTIVLDPIWGFENRTLTLTHAVKFLPCTAYQFTVAGLDKKGRDLVPGPVDNPYNFTTLCTYPRVTQTSPFKGQTNVLLDASISVTFSESMDNESVMDSFTFMDDRMILFTKSDGVFQWNADNTTFIFSPNSPFRAQASYSVKLNASIAHGLADNFLDGNTNGAMDLPRYVDDYSWWFTTALVNDAVPPTVQSVSPVSGASDVARDVTVSVVFSEPMNKPSVQGAILPSDSRVAYDFRWPNNTTVNFKIIPLMFHGTTYTMKVKTSATDLVGNRLAEEYSWSFTTLKWRGSVHGRVVDEADGSPIANATVVLDGVPSLTDSGGNFTIANMEQSTAVWLNITKDGYVDNRSLVGFGEGSQDLGTIKLRKVVPPSQVGIGVALILIAVVLAAVFVVILMMAMRRRRKVQPTKFEEWKGEVAEVEPGEGRP